VKNYSITTPIRHSLLALAIAAASGPLFADVTQNQADTMLAQASPAQSAGDIAQVEQALVAAAQPEPVDIGLQIEEQIYSWETDGKGQVFKRRSEAGSLFYVTAQAPVMQGPDSRDWGNAREMAYKEATLKAQAKYLEYLGTNITASSASKLFDDQSQMPSFSAEELRSSNNLIALLDKAVALAGAKLDSALQEMGVDPSEFKAAPKEKRATLFQRSVRESVTTTATHSLTGVIPVKTFEAYDSEGNHVVAVAIVASNKFRQFVADVARSKGDIAAKPERASTQPLSMLLRNDKTALLNEFGIRRMYDKNGYPVLISFGQSSNPYRGKDFQRKADQRELSYAAAKASAYANFAYLFKSTGTSKDISSKDMKKQVEGVVRAEGTSVEEGEESTVEFIRAVNREISVRGKINNLTGTRELFRWTTKHPMYGHEINGVVYIWHPVSEQRARELKNFKPARQAASPQSKQTQQHSAGSSQSRDLMSADDF